MLLPNVREWRLLQIRGKRAVGYEPLNSTMHGLENIHLPAYAHDGSEPRVHVENVAAVFSKLDATLLIAGLMIGIEDLLRFHPKP